jgi:hypothetical protein
MPVSAFIQSVAYFLLAAVALFASAGTVTIATYWVYLAIFAAVFIVSFLWLDPDLARERIRPGGKRPPITLQLIYRCPRLPLDHRRPRSRPLPLE